MKSMCDLPRWKDTNDKLDARSAFRGVSFHRQKGVFVVTDARTGSTYSTDREAATARGRALGVSDIAQKRNLRQQLLALRMGVVRSIFFPQRGPQLPMGDLEAAMHHKKHSACMYAAFPATEGISIQLKYIP